MKLFIFIPFLVILIGAASLGGVYYYTQYLQPKNASPLSQLAGPITQEPASLTLELGSPTEDTLSFEPNTLVSGRTSPSSQVLINNEAKDVVIEAKKDGSFSTLFDLAEGVNIIQVTVFDKNGDERSVSRTVYYSKEKI